MEITVWPFGAVEWHGRRVRCALGRGGVRRDKREGDGATPVGVFPLRSVLFRPDRVPLPQTRLPVRALRPEDGWCDDAAHHRYNRRVALPFAAGHEALWRADHLYDLIVVIGYNDAPVAAGRGSAIFLHIAAPDYRPTDGCIATAYPDLRDLMRAAAPGDRLRIHGPAGPPPDPETGARPRPVITVDFG